MNSRALKKIRLIVGLGNPGAEYLTTRHNVGFWFVDALADEVKATFRQERRFSGALARIRIGEQGLLLLKPETYMNRSGLAVRSVVDYYQIPAESVLVVHDDLDLPVGIIRIKQKGGHGGHNGLRDIIRHIGPDFVRMRFGIGHPAPGEDVIDYVLRPPQSEELDAIIEAMRSGAEQLGPIVSGDVEGAMRRLHTKQVGKD